MTRTVIDQIPSTEMQTQFKTEYKTQNVPVTRTVVDQVPTTQMQTRYRTEYKSRTVPVSRSVPEIVNVPRTYTVYVPQQQTVNQQIWKTILEPVTKTEKQYRYNTVMKTVPQTEYQPKTVSFTTSRVETSLVPESYTESVPVTTYSQGRRRAGLLPERSACPLVCVVPVACGTAADAARSRAAEAIRLVGDARPRSRPIPPSRFSSRGRSCGKCPRRATCSKRERGSCRSKKLSRCPKPASRWCR